MKKLAYLLLVLIVACKNSDKSKTSVIPDGPSNEINSPSSPVDSLIQEVGHTHAKQKYSTFQAIKFDLVVNFRGEKRVDAVILTSTDMSRIKMMNRQGEFMIFDGSDIWLSPKTADKSKVRFDIFTWPYFALLPFKLDDPGTEYTDFVSQGDYKLTRLSFEEGTGDTPDDWYDLFIDADNRLAAAGYIVTFGDKTVTEAEKNAHAIRYARYQDIQGIPLSTFWTFHNYENGEIQSEMIGNAFLSNPLLLEKASDKLFTIPKNAVKID